MTDDAEDIGLAASDIVKWSPRHGPMVGAFGQMRPQAWPLSATGMAMVGALALGALAIGALAIGRLAVGQARLGEVKISRLEIGDLVVARRNGRPF